MKNILVTGVCGFIASNLVNKIFDFFRDYQIKVIGIDKMFYPIGTANIDPDILLSPNFKFIKGDIGNKDLINFILKEYRIDTVLHLGANTHVDRSFENSIEFTYDNIVGTHVLIEACRHYGRVEKFVHLSTDECYGPVSNNVPCDENAPLSIRNPYAATKASAELILQSYGYSYNFPYIIIRMNNIYGERQYPDKLIPKFILLLNRNKKVSIHGDGTARRTFIHVDDAIRGIFTITLKGMLREIYNIGSNNEYSVMEITKLICHLMNKEPEECIEYVKDRNFQDMRYLINYDKIKSLGWEEEIPFEEGLKGLINWYLTNSELYTN